MNRADGRLADGREIHYYTLHAAPTVPSDRRDLAAVATASELRYDPILDEWVTLATHRQGRTHLPPAAECPLCPSRDGRLTEIPAASYEVVAFDNRFPSLGMDVAGIGPGADAGEPLFERRPGRGHCEVVCFSDDHTASVADLPETRVRLIVDVLAERSGELLARADVAQVFCFENRGREIGVTLSHPHGQVYGYPFVTPRTNQMLRSAGAYRKRTGGDLLADVVAAERRAGTRVVLDTEYWSAFVPSAARWPVEVHLYPHRRVLELPALDAAERAELATVLLDLLGRLDAYHDLPLPYIAAWHQAPMRQDRDLAYLHLELFSIRRSADKLKYLAGSEAAMGAFISDVAPEAVAARLRAVGP